MKMKSVYPKNFHDSSDICLMGFLYFIQLVCGPAAYKQMFSPISFRITGIGATAPMLVK